MVKIQYVSTEEKIVDVTKNPLSMTNFRNFRDKHGMVENISLTERDC